MKSPTAFSEVPRSLPGCGGSLWERATDMELAVAAGTRDRAGQEAFMEIVRRHRAAVCAVAWSIAGRAGLTDDVAQETFLKAWRRITTLRDPARLKAWLTRIAHDCAVDALRREEPHKVSSDSGLAPAYWPGPSPDSAAADAEEEALVWTSLAALPENLRIPLVLFYREGKSVAAVAAAMDLSEETVRQRLSRGRQSLRAAVERRVETVLGQARPPALLAAAIAAGIGMPGPSAVAAGVGAGAGVAGGTVAGAGTAGVFSFMTATSWLAAALFMAAFLPLGWQSGSTVPGPAGGRLAPSPVTGQDDPWTAFPNSRLLAAWRRLHAEHGSDAASMPVIYSLVQAESDDFQRRALGIALISEWAAVDPEGAFRTLWSEKKNTDHAGWMMREWLKLDPSRATGHLLTHLGGAETLAAAVAGDVAELAPEHFMALLTALPAVPDSPLAFGQVFPNTTAATEAFARFARSRPQEAMNALPMLKGQLLISAQVSLASVLAEKDPAAALAWARAQPVPDGSGAPVAAVIELWSRTDPAAALAAAGSDRKMAGVVLETVAKRDPAAGLALRQAHPDKFDGDSWSVLGWSLGRLFETGPSTALALLRDQPPGIQKSLMDTLDLSELSPASLQSVRKWMLGEKPEGLAGDLCGKLIGSAFYRDPEEGFRQLRDLPPEWRDRVGRSAIPDMVGHFSNRQLEDLLGLFSGEARTPLLAAAFRHGHHGSPPDLSLWRERLEELPVESQPDAAGGFASSLVYADPLLAMAFADSTPEGPVRDKAYSEAMEFWAYIDSLAASAYADRLPPGGGRDAAAAALAGRLGSQDPAALAWCAAIGNEGLRVSALTKLMDDALSNGPATAAALLASPQISAPDRQALLLARPQLNAAK